MTKKGKWKYKYLAEEKFNKYMEMDQEELIKTLKKQASHQEKCKKAKSGSDYLKDITKDIADFRKNWEKNNAEEMEQAKAAMESIKAKRDAGIEDAIEEKKDFVGGLNDAIAGASEHVEALLHCLRFHK